MENQFFKVADQENGLDLVFTTDILNVDNAKWVSIEIDQVLKDREVDALYLDLSNLEIIDSSGISVILGLHRKLQDTKLYLKLGNDRVRDVFNILNVSDFFTFV
jgi:anti-anti-sigma factor